MIGYIALFSFLLIMFASIRRWLPQDVLPLQSVLVLGALALLGLALLSGHPFRPAQLIASTTLHPITAIIAGFMLASAVEAGGGFTAASRILSRIGASFLGLSGTIVLLVNVPILFAMPCGRVWAAALLPAAIMFSSELARQRNNPSIVPIVVIGFIVNAAASCGPSPLGGIGMMGEGTAGFTLGSFSNAQQMSIMVITQLTMAAAAFLYKIPTSRVAQFPPQQAFSTNLPKAAYFVFFFYVICLGVVFIIRPSVPLQTILLGMTVVVMIAGRVTLRELMAGIIIHPVTAMVAGFIMGGALLVTGGFDALITILGWLAAHTPLGPIGVSVLLIYLPIIFPMPCGRIFAAALLPGVFLFGQELSRVTGSPGSLPALLIGFILSCAASCGPSPLGGIGSIGEGNLGIRSGLSGMPQQFGIFLGVPVAAMVVTYLGLSSEIFRLNETALALGLGFLSGMTTNVLLRYRFYHLGGILGGLVVGSLILVM